jgi:3-deoxy-manno-octulosonate cytidylyltransferase (CMP-KDO synthetase)
MSDVVVAIPARWGSTRLPGKPLRLILGKPMIQHVVERVRRAPGVTRAVVLTDDQRIERAVQGFGGDVEMTPETCQSGTDRIAWAAREWQAEIVVNVQGDEPLIDPNVVSAVANHLAEHPGDEMATVAARAEPDILDDPNAVKVVLDRAGYALYFSRAAIPFPRHGGIQAPLRHLGLYGYRRETLLRFAGLEPTPLERTESLEQLRALEHGIRIRVLRAARAVPGVDTEEDLRKVEHLLRARFDQTGA